MIQRRKELRLTLEASEPIGIISEGVSQNFDRGFLINSAVDEIATPITILQDWKPQSK